MTLLYSLNVRNIVLSKNAFTLCFDWMRNKGVTFYDAAYLAAAHDIGAILVTSDEKFVRKMGKVGNVCLLKDIVL